MVYTFLPAVYIIETEKLYQEAIHLSGQLVEKREQLIKLEAKVAWPQLTWTHSAKKLLLS